MSLQKDREEFVAPSRGVSRMSDVDRTYLNTILAAHREKSDEVPADEHFEFFVAEQITMKHDLDPEEVKSGITRGNRDGGIDAVYVLIDRRLIGEDPDIKAFQKRGVSVDLLIIQATRSAGFSEDAIDKLLATTNDLLDVSRKDINNLASAYNARLLEIVERFRSAYLGLLTFAPSLTITYYYASQGDAVDANVLRKTDGLLDRIKTLYSAASCDFRFLGAKELLNLFNQRTPQALTLQTNRSIASSKPGTAYVCLVPLSEYFEFIVDDAGDMREAIFESNIRDYNPGVQVNKEIQITLATGAQDEFWWLNNGITILGSKVTSTGDILVVEDPEIVNGLQTSTEIYNYGKSGTTLRADTRNVLVRVIQTSDSQVRDRIIKATNNQTPVSQFALHATESVHRDIENYFHKHGLYYERRKNFYRNRGIQVSKIITIPFLAQAVGAIALQRPDDVRARPSTLRQRYYAEMFDAQYPPDLYRNCALLQKRVQAVLRQPSLGLDKGVQSNIRFHVAMYAACLALKSVKPSRQEIAQLELGNITDEFLGDCCQHVARRFQALGGTDQVAKGAALVDELRNDITAYVKRERKQNGSA